ncbi:NADPH-dependent FMN reductase [Devriesea agamarum]|uniref:NADPH-dependent FMN reductase n=1 Tax=Devriesea agamarum TaxID=472569 RepID=UPI00071CC060|nr:NAD(P)H-dependent oxidoreductase [Devriesea agamarum]
MKIGIVLGSIRENRAGEAVAHWVYDDVSATCASMSRATGEHLAVELIDIAAFRIPLLTTPIHPAKSQRTYDSEGVTAFSRAVDSCDAYIFVTAEHNHSVPGAMKNAVDSLMPEWWGKAVAFVSYGGNGGIRAVEHWRQILGNFNMYDVRQSVSLSLTRDLPAPGEEFKPSDRRKDELAMMLSQLLTAAKVATDRL